LSPHALKICVIAAVAALSIQAARAGQILITDTSPGSATLTTFSPIDSYSSGACTQASSNAYDYCYAYWFAPASFNSTPTAFIQIVNDATNASQSYAYSNSSSYYQQNGWANADNSAVPGVQFFVQEQGGEIGGKQLLGFSFTDFQGYSYINNFPCNGTCNGTVSGGVQEAFTFNYLDSSNNVLGSDTISFQAESPTVPEPGSTLLLFSGLAMVGAGLAWRKRLARNS
jgi:hypothetical protein